MIKDKFRRYLVEAIGEERSLVAFAAFEKQASVSVRLNPFKPCPEPADARTIAWSRHGRILKERLYSLLILIFMGEHIMCRTHLPCS